MQSIICFHILLLVKVSLHRPPGTLPGLGPLDSRYDDPPIPEPRVNIAADCCLLRATTQLTASSTRSRRTVARRSQVRVLYTSVWSRTLSSTGENVVC